MSEYTKFPRGSEWRRWDLHVHTKGTHKNDNFTSPDFGAFCRVLFEKALQADICAIGITDYFSVENYKKVLEYQSKIDSSEYFSGEEKEKIKNVFLLPNVELRMLPTTEAGRLINIHCIFNPHYVSELENDFFTSIEHCSGASFSCKMNKAGMIALGTDMDPTLNDNEAKYKKGIASFVVSHESLRNIWDGNKRFRENTIIVVANSSTDGASGLNKHYDLFENESSSLDSVRRAIYRLSKMIFSGNPQDREYFLGNKSDSAEVVKEKCGSLKSCIHGSDAHDENKLFMPDGKRYCWIKSDLTFEGLKQVAYEPEDRVRVQELKPEEKESYHVIDSVAFIDESFMSNELLLNQNLNVIIGGKSTGKSILLRNIAQSIDSEEVAYQLKNVEIVDYKKRVKDFRTIWVDEQVSVKSKDKESNPNKKVMYIPQSYLNRLVDKVGEKTAIDSIIENVLKQQKQNVYDSLRTFEMENAKKISNAVSDLFDSIDSLKLQRDKIKNIGDKKGIEKQVELLEGVITDLKKTTGMTPEEIEKYDGYVKEIKRFRDVIAGLQADIEVLGAVKKRAVFNALDDFELSSPGIKDTLLAVYEDLKKKHTLEWNANLDLAIGQVKERLTLDSQTTKKLETEFKPLFEKAQKVGALNEKIKQIELQQAKLTDIKKEEDAESRIRDRCKLLCDEILQLHSMYYYKLNEARSAILEQSIIAGDLTFQLDVVFKSQAYKTEFIEKIFNLVQLDKSMRDYKYEDIDTYKSHLRDVFRSIMKGDLAFKQGFHKQEAIISMLNNWFMLEYKVKHGADDLSSMSPGKKSLVLLKLLIELDNSRCPILLDQPEDDLDNRSIYNELVAFIKRKKKERQIIITTHNPNLVVGADAECVIVANQQGLESPNEHDMFEYVQGSLEHSMEKDGAKGVLYKKGVRQHVCDILEGGKDAFKKREQRYSN